MTFDQMQETEPQGKVSRFSRMSRKEMSQWTAKVAGLSILLMGGLMLSWAVLVWAPWTDSFYQALANENSHENSMSMPVALAVGLTIAWLLSILAITKFVRHRGDNGWGKGLMWMVSFGLITILLFAPVWILLEDHLAREGALGDAVSMAITFFSFAVLVYTAFMAGRYLRPLSLMEIVIGPPEEE